MPNFKCTTLAVALKGLFVRLPLNIIYLYVPKESYVKPKATGKDQGSTVQVLQKDQNKAFPSA